MFFIILGINQPFSHQAIPTRRLQVYSIGTAVHIALLLVLYFKKNLNIQISHAPCIVLSFLIFVFIGTTDQSQFLSVNAQLLIITVSVIIMNECWYITSFCIFLSIFTTLCYLAFINDLPMGVIAPQFLILAFVLCYITF